MKIDTYPVIKEYMEKKMYFGTNHDQPSGCLLVSEVKELYLTPNIGGKS